MEEEFKSDVLHSGLLMSHPSKLEFLQIARKQGYKTYLYFVFTDDLNTNLARAQLRGIGWRPRGVGGTHPGKSAKNL